MSQFKVLGIEERGLSCTAEHLEKMSCMSPGKKLAGQEVIVPILSDLCGGFWFPLCSSWPLWLTLLFALGQAV